MMGSTSKRLMVVTLASLWAVAITSEAGVLPQSKHLAQEGANKKNEPQVTYKFQIDFDLMSDQAQNAMVFRITPEGKLTARGMAISAETKFKFSKNNLVFVFLVADEKQTSAYNLFRALNLMKDKLPEGSTAVFYIRMKSFDP